MDCRHVFSTPTSQLEQTEGLLPLPSSEIVGQWLSPSDHGKHQEDLMQKCDPQVGQWLFRSDVFKDWAKGRPWKLRLYGNPGSGKTMLAAQVADHLKKHLSSANSVLNIFLSSRDPDQHSERRWLGSMLRQLVLDPGRRRSELIQDMQQMFIDSNGLLDPSIETLRRTLVEQITQYERVFVIVDGMDECDEDVREHLEQFIEDISNTTTGRFSWLLSSRWFDGYSESVCVSCDKCQKGDLKIYWTCEQCPQLYQLCGECQGRGLSCPVGSHSLKEFSDATHITVKVETPLAILKAHIRWRINKETRKTEPQNGESLARKATTFGQHLIQETVLPEKIVEQISQRAMGNIHFATMYFDLLRDSAELNTIYSLLNDSKLSLSKTRNIRLPHDNDETHHVMSHLPQALLNLYDESLRFILRMLNKFDKLLALRTLSFLSHARGPLTFKELQHALAVSMFPSCFEHTSWDEWMSRITRDKIIRVTRGLVATDVRGQDDFIMRPFHATAEAYLLYKRNEHFRNGHELMANVCMDYLQQQTMSHQSTSIKDFEKKKIQYPFMMYAASFWGDHVRMVKKQTHELKMKALRFTQNAECQDACWQAAWYTQEKWLYGINGHRGASGLHACAFFGLHSVIAMDDAHVMAAQANTTQVLFKEAPLIYACRRGWYRVVKRLLEFGADVHAVNTCGHTAITEAIIGRYIDVVKLLLDHSKYKGRSVPLVHSSLYAVVHKNRSYFRAPLAFAVETRNLAMVREIRSHLPACITEQDSEGRIALQIAACIPASSEKDKLLKLAIVWELLEASSDTSHVNFTDKALGKSALCLAVEKHECDIVNLLLSRGACPFVKDKQRGGTVILRTVEFSFLDVLISIYQYLTNVVNKPVVLEIHNQTHTELHSTLDNDGRTLLHGACERKSGKNGSNNLKVVKFLHDTVNFELDMLDYNKSTPLHEACRSGCSDVVDYLLTNGAQAMLKDSHGRTAHDIARQYKQPDVVKILRYHAPPATFHEPLNVDDSVWAAFACGNLDLLQNIIHDRTGILDQREMRTGNSVLHFCILLGKPYASVLRLLLNSARVNVNAINALGRTPLHYAVGVATPDAVKKLLEDGRVELELQDIYGRTSLADACLKRKWENAMLLVERGADPLAPWVDSQQLLFEAINLERTEVVRKLIECGISVMTKDEEGRTAFRAAIEKENQQLVCMMRTKMAPVMMIEEGL